MIIRFNGHDYGIIYESGIRTFRTNNFDYLKTFTKAAKEIEETKKFSTRFELVANIEGNPEPVGGLVRFHFLMPGLINQIINIDLDLQQQDLSGKMALLTNCLMEVLPNGYPQPVRKPIDGRKAQV
jgi:hypothetical protein